ncbi:MAG: hypothetical protein IKL47_03810 [Clostridia bacterium]|nr:hypothetical protein [Clostridia bacterium]
MNKEILKNILNTPSMEFSYEEIQALLDEELEKPVEEMDTDIVELCIDVLSRKETESSEKKDNENDCKTKSHKKRNVGKIFLIAAVVAMLSIITVSVSANVFTVEASEGIVSIFGKQLSLNLTKFHNKKVLSEPKELGVKNVYLLPIFYDKNCKLELIEQSNNNYHKLNFSFTDSEVTGYISIKKYASYENSLDSINLYSDTEQIKQINIGGTDVIITSATNSKVLAYYNINNKNYTILFENSSFDKIVELLENS